MKAMTFKKTALVVALSAGSMYGATVARADTFWAMPPLYTMDDAPSLYTIFSVPLIETLDKISPTKLLEQSEAVVKAITNDLQGVHTKLNGLYRELDKTPLDDPKRVKILNHINETNKQLRDYSSKLYNSKGLKALVDFPEFKKISQKIAANTPGALLGGYGLWKSIETLHNTDWSLSNSIEIGVNLFNVYDNITSFVPVVGWVSAGMHLVVEAPLNYFFNKKADENNNLIEEFGDAKARIVKARAEFARQLRNTSGTEDLQFMLSEHNQYMANELLVLKDIKERIDKKIFMALKSDTLDAIEAVMNDLRSNNNQNLSDAINMAYERHEKLKAERAEAQQRANLMKMMGQQT